MNIGGPIHRDDPEERARERQAAEEAARKSPLEYEDFDDLRPHKDIRGG